MLMTNTRKNRGTAQVDLSKVQVFLMSQNGTGPKGETEGDPDASVSTLPRTARPSLYKVILLNDDFTPMDFVVLILKKFFSKSDGEAQRVMFQVHQDGAAVAGVYTFELAETK